MEKALIIAAGDWPSESIWRPLVEDADVIIATDGAARQARLNDVMPAVIIGDLDSIGEEELEHHPEAEIIHLERQDDSDLAKALKWANMKRYNSEIIGIEGGRPDHVLQAYTVLFENGVGEAIVHLDGWTVQRIVDNLSIDVLRGSIVSLFAFGRVKNITIDGLVHELAGVDLTTGTLGLHNEGLGRAAHISHSGGHLLLMIER